MSRILKCQELIPSVLLNWSFIKVYIKNLLKKQGQKETQQALKKKSIYL